MILHDCEIWYPSLDPERPNSKHNKTQPTWQIQLRTRNKEQKAEWEAAGLKLKTNVDDDERVYYSVNLYRKSVKNDGSPGKVPDLVDGELEQVDPRTIGNGSIANIRIFQYTSPATKDSPEKLTSVLMGVQLTKHIVYTPKPREPEEEFGKTKTVVEGEKPQATSEDDADHMSGGGFTKSEPAPEGSDKARETPRF